MLIRMSPIDIASRAQCYCWQYHWKWYLEHSFTVLYTSQCA